MVPGRTGPLGEQGPCRKTRKIVDFVAAAYFSKLNAVVIGQSKPRLHHCLPSRIDISHVSLYDDFLFPTL